MTLAARWEARLASEGLASLDFDVGGGCVAVSGRGDARPRTDSRADLARDRHRRGGTIEEAARAGVARAQYAQLQRDVMAHHRFGNARDRRAWRLHAAGDSLRTIAREMRTTIWDVRKSIDGTLAAWRGRREMNVTDDEPIDPEVGAALAEAMHGCTTLDEAFERARDIPELAQYLEA